MIDTSKIVIYGRRVSCACGARPEAACFAEGFWLPVKISPHAMKFFHQAKILLKKMGRLWLNTILVAQVTGVIPRPALTRGMARPEAARPRLLSRIGSRQHASTAAQPRSPATANTRPQRHPPSN
jgi:hypothetical protein